MTKPELREWIEQTKVRILAAAAFFVGKRRVPQRYVAKRAGVREGLLSAYVAKYPEIETAVSAVTFLKRDVTKQKMLKAIQYFKDKEMRAGPEKVRKKARISRVVGWRCRKRSAIVRNAMAEIKPISPGDKCQNYISHALTHNVQVRHSDVVNANGFCLTTYYKTRRRNQEIATKIHHLNLHGTGLHRICFVAQYLRGRGEVLAQHEFAYLANVSLAALSFHLKKPSDSVRKVVQGTVRMSRTPRRSPEDSAIRKRRLEILKEELRQRAKDPRAVQDAINSAA